MRTYRSPKPVESEGGPGSAGQSGDTQGLSDVPNAGLSVRALVEAGQNFEAEVLMGVEEGRDPEVVEVQTHQARKDEVPSKHGKAG